MSAFLVRYGTALGALALFIAFAIAAPNFLALGNLLNITRHIAFMAILAIGFTLALTTGELDLSFANVASLAAVTCAGLVHNGHPVILAIAAALAIGLAFGVFNGVLVTMVKIPSLIATLATAAAANGFAFMITQGVAFVGRWPTGFTGLGRATILGLPVLALWVILAAALALFLLKQTRTGVHMLATGEAPEAARRAGIATRRVKILGLALSGLAAGITAVLLAAALSSAAPTAAGDFLLSGIAAVLLGMTMFEPGRPNIPGTLVGALTIGMLANGLVLLGFEYYWQDIALCLIMIASVAISSTSLKQAAFGHV